MRSRTSAQLLATCGLMIAGCAGPRIQLAPVQTSETDSVELGRFAGKWYEIARFPNFFQSNSVAATVEYTLAGDGNIEVVNRYRVGSLDGPEREMKASAEVTDPETNTRLKIRFFGLFEGQCWILDVGNDYDWAVVGTPSGKLLWILSRTPTLEEETYRDLVASLPQMGFDTSKLVKTPQPQAN